MSLPKTLTDFLISQLIKDSIGSKHNEIVNLVINLEIGYLRLSDKYFGIATESL